MRQSVVLRAVKAVSALLLLTLAVAGCDSPKAATTPQEASQQEAVTQQGVNVKPETNPAASSQDAVTKGATPTPAGK